MSQIILSSSFSSFNFGLDIVGRINTTFALDPFAEFGDEDSEILTTETLSDLEEMNTCVFQLTYSKLV